MSRHRIVRRMNYEDECYDEDDDYGQSYEDRYCISPSTAAQFTYNRERNFDLSSYMEEEIAEEGEMDVDLEPAEAQAAASPAGHEGLSDIDRGRLQSCLEEIHNVMGDSMGDSVLTDAILRHKFNIQAALDELLSQTDVPKPQRTPRKKRERTQGDDTDIEDLLSEISALDQQEHLLFKGVGGRFRFQKGMSPPVGVGVASSQEIGRGVVRSVKSSSSSMGSPGSLPGSDLSPPSVLKALGNTRVRRERGDSGSDTSSSSSSVLFSSPPKSSLMAVIQQQKTSEQQRSGHGGVSSVVGKELEAVSTERSQEKSSSVGPQTMLSSALKEEGSKSSGLSLSDLIRAQKGSVPESSKHMPPDSSAAIKSTGLSLSDIIRAQKSAAAESPMHSTTNSPSPSQACQQKPSSCLSLRELIAQKQTSSSSAPSSVVSSSSVSLSVSASAPASSAVSSNVSSSPQMSKGLSLTELIKLRSSQEPLDASVRAKSSQSEVDGSSSSSSKSSSMTGLSLSQLIHSHSQSQSRLTTVAAASDIPTPSQGGRSGADLGASATPHLVPERSAVQAESRGRAGGRGLSLSELIKQHQSRGSKPASAPSAPSPSQDINANTTVNRESSQIAEKLEQSLTFRSEDGRTQVSSENSVLKNMAVGDKKDVMSLADCLKKKMIFQSKHSKSDLPGVESNSAEQDEEDYPEPPHEIEDFEADIFDPLKVDPVMRKVPSLFARCICLQTAEKTRYEGPAPVAVKKKARFPRFQFSYQTRKREALAEIPLHKIPRFDFKTPSPDDIVKARQKGAFTRTGQHVLWDKESNP